MEDIVIKLDPGQRLIVEYNLPAETSTEFEMPMPTLGVTLNDFVMSLGMEPNPQDPNWPTGPDENPLPGEFTWQELGSELCWAPVE
jgi:hypothetical protein